MKIAKIILLAALLTVLLAACSGESEFVITNTSIEMTDGSFTGTETHVVSLTAGTEVTFNIVTRSGSLDINIYDESGNVVAGGSGIAGRIMAFTMNEDGEYTIRINGNSHQGSFEIFWG